MLDNLRAQLKRHEGLRLHPYRDSVGKLTIGIGRNLDDRGITEAEAYTLLDNDLVDVRWGLRRELPWVNQLDEPRHAALINMGFNLGVPGLLEFKNMLSALEREDWQTAHDEALRSRWAEQVGYRAGELAEQLRTGEWQGVNDD